MTRFVIALALVGFVGCSNDSSVGPDLAHADLTVEQPDSALSVCGKPGELGNPLGVGKFCRASSDCSDNGMSTLCSSVGNRANDPSQYTFFCAFTCNADAPPGYCGAGASCACASQGCACAPDACIPPDLGG